MNAHHQLEHLQARYVGTGHADTTKFEWAQHQHRDTLASHVGHTTLMAYFAVAENESIGRLQARFADRAPAMTLKATAAKKRQALFVPFRALGYVTADIPMSVQARGQAYFITSSIGDSFQIFDGDKMRLLFVGPKMDSPITAIASFKDLTFAASQSSIVVFSRAKEVFRLKPKGASADITHLLVLGELLFSVDLDNAIRMWDFKAREYVNEISLGRNFTVTSILHPSTYLNKVLLGSQQGSMQLWNVRSMKMIYEFKAYASPIATLAQSPSIDVVAIGLLDGTIILHNIKADKEILRFKQDGKVTAVSFRTDGQPVMATASMYGDIALWDLDERRLIHVMKGAHDAAVHTCMFYNGTPILLTASSDNSIKASAERPALIRDAQNVELSQGSLEEQAKKTGSHIDALKLPQIVQFSANTAKEKEWDNIITCHINQTVARTWHFQRKAIGKHQLVSLDGSSIKAVAVSACGNYGFIGTIKGRIDRFNMQSGQHRQAYTGGDFGHTKAVTAIASDNVNRVVYSTSIDKSLKFWDFKTGKVLHTMQFETAISHMMLHSESGLLALATDDMCIRVVDVDTRKIVREFWGHMNRITDMAFSSDGRWIVSSSLDGTIRTWDLPTGYLIDGFRVSEIPTSVTLSPLGDFLATTHVNHVGVFLWANRSQYDNVPIQRMDDTDLFATAAALPTSGGKAEVSLDDEVDTADGAEMDTGDDDLLTPQDLVDGMISLSSLPKSRWKNLLSLEAIKKRNKPIEPPKAPERAPFFLPTVAGATPHFDLEDDSKDKGDGSRVLRNASMTMNQLARQLTACSATGDYDAVMAFLKEQSPSSTDIEIRTLPLDAEHTHLRLFLDFICHQLERHRDFELANAYLNVFLRIHGDVLQNGDEATRDALARVQERADQAWARLEGKLQYALCVVDFARGVAL
ncbi:rRNA-processing protein utp21 [Polyrhizophydium stewartii]|uniref:rRNA-processing protein utp21 n=1 Tax=Polyrhizophydium stewartii TaxID=2732419 RepID=A0ABR4MYI3_9FUNG